MNSFPLWYIRIHIVSSVYGGGSCRWAAPSSGPYATWLGQRDPVPATAGEFGATEALRIGLVQEVVPAGQQLDRGGGDRLRGGRPGAAWVQGTLASAWRGAPRPRGKRPSAYPRRLNVILV